MPIKALAPLALLFLLAACAAPMGSAAGTAVGGAGWVAMKTGKFAVKTTVKTVKLAGRAMGGGGGGHAAEEPQPAATEPQAAAPTQVSQAESTALPY